MSKKKGRKGLLKGSMENEKGNIAGNIGSKRESGWSNFEFSINAHRAYESFSINKKRGKK